MKIILCLLALASNALLFGMESHASDEEKKATPGIWFNAYTIDATNDGHTQQVYDVQFTPDGEFFISSSADQTIKIFDMATKRCVHVWEADDGIGAYKGHLAISPNGKILASAKRKVVSIYDLATLKYRSGLEFPRVVTALFFDETDSTDTRLLYLLGAEHVIIREEVKEGAKKNSGLTWDASFARSPDKTLISCRDNNDIFITKPEHVKLEYHIPPGESIFSTKVVEKAYNVQQAFRLNKDNGGHAGKVNSIQFSPDNQWLISGSEDKTIKLFKRAQIENQEQAELCMDRYEQGPLNIFAGSDEARIYQSLPAEEQKWVGTLVD